MDAGQPHDHVIAETVESIIGASRWDRLDREISPLGELHGKQPPHQCWIGFYLVSMHFFNGHEITSMQGIT